MEDVLLPWSFFFANFVYVTDQHQSGNVCAAGRRYWLLSGFSVVAGGTRHADPGEGAAEAHQRCVCAFSEQLRLSPRRLSAEADPIQSPTMAGGLFGGHVDYFWEIGGYDEEWGYWGTGEAAEPMRTY